MSGRTPQIAIPRPGFLWLTTALGALALVGNALGGTGLALADFSRPADAPAAPLVYVAIGASDGVGAGVDNPAEQGWVALFSDDVGPDTSLFNFSAYGALVDEAQQTQLPPALAAQPDLVTVWLGVNDFNNRTPLATYRRHLGEILGGLRTQTSARILIGNLPDLSHVPNYASLDPAAVRAEVLRWNRGIAAEAETVGATLVDLYGYGQDLALHPDYVSADGLHPSAAGYRRVADLFAQALADSAGG